MHKPRTKIIATIGPATLKFAVFQKLVDSGIDFIRINTSYGNEHQYNQILKNLRYSANSSHIEPILDVKNLDILDYAIKNNIKYIALSFVESADQIKKVREKMPESFVISKIESVGGVDNFTEILDASNGIMVARGDLGVAVSLEKVPPLQKYFTKLTIEKNKFLVAATEMLLSMVNNPTPTRAEASDVANAVFDGSSAVMLSEETAIGKHPVETVQIMKKIIVEAEKYNGKLT